MHWKTDNICADAASASARVNHPFPVVCHFGMGGWQCVSPAVSDQHRRSCAEKCHALHHLSWAKFSVPHFLRCDNCSAASGPVASAVQKCSRSDCGVRPKAGVGRTSRSIPWRPSSVTRWPSVVVCTRSQLFRVQGLAKHDRQSSCSVEARVASCPVRSRSPISVCTTVKPQQQQSNSGARHVHHNSASKMGRIDDGLIAHEDWPHTGNSSLGPGAQLEASEDRAPSRLANNSEMEAAPTRTQFCPRAGTRHR